MESPGEGNFMLISSPAGVYKMQMDLFPAISCVCNAVWLSSPLVGLMVLFTFYENCFPIVC